MAGHWGANPYNWEVGNTNVPHVTRYYLARGFVYPHENVLDGGCGTGYGTMMLGEVAKTATGYEVDKGCVDQANRDHKLENTFFEHHDLDTCEIEPGKFDVAVSIEVVEHLNDMHHYVDQLHKSINRLIVITVPLGGTTWAYKDEEPSPATEKNDFMTGADVDTLMVNDEWQKFSNFEFGYSYFGVYFKSWPEKR